MGLFRSLFLVLVLIVMVQSLKGSSYFGEPVNPQDPNNPLVLQSASPSSEPH